MADGSGWASPGGALDADAEPTPTWPSTPPSPSGTATGAAWGAPDAATRPGWSGWSGTPAATKPGVIPLRPLGVGEILDGAITTVRRYPRATLGIAAVVVTITQLVQFGLVEAFAGSLADPAAREDVGLGGVGTGAGVLALAMGFVSNVMLTGALTVVVGQAVLGRPIELLDAWRAVRTRLLALVGTALLVLLLNGIALVLLLLPFLFAWPALSLATPALMLERQGVRGALRRSVALVRGQFWRCLGVVLLAAIIKSVVGFALATPFIMLGGGLELLDPTPAEDVDLGRRYLLMTTIGGIVSGTVVAPFSAGVSALLYVDRRMRAEGLDVTLAANAAGPAPDVPRTAG